MVIFNGNELAKKLEEKISDFIKTHTKEGSLAIIQIGDNPASTKYVNLKKKLCAKLGITTQIISLDSALSDDALLGKVEDIFANPAISGGIIQLPLPRKSLDVLLEQIPASKDIDLISPNSLTKFYNGDFSRLSPVIRSFNLFTQECQLDIKDRKVIFIGNGYLIGKPLSYYLEQMGSRVEVIENYRTGDVLDCDVLVTGVGIPNLINPWDLKKPCAVVDFGTSVIEGKVVGDVDLTAAQTPEGHQRITYFSPSPGGMGPLVVRYLLMNYLGI